MSYRRRTTVRRVRSAARRASHVFQSRRAQARRIRGGLISFLGTFPRYPGGGSPPRPFSTARVARVEGPHPAPPDRPPTGGPRERGVAARKFEDAGAGGAGRLMGEGGGVGLPRLHRRRPPLAPPRHPPPPTRAPPRCLCWGGGGGGGQGGGGRRGRQGHRPQGHRLGGHRRRRLQVRRHHPVDEFLDETGIVTVQVGDTVDVLLERTEDREGHIVLSQARRPRR